MRVGIIGAGNVVHYGHYPALMDLKSDVQVVALADVTDSRRVAARDLFGLSDAACYADPLTVAAHPDVEAVLVAVPQQFRRPIVEAAARAGKHILSEKPIATTPADAQAMIDAANAAGVTYAICHNYLFLPEYIKLRQIIERGTIGNFRVGIMNYLGVQDRPGAAEYQPAWRHSPQAGGGVLMDMIHAVYLVEWLFGGTITRASAMTDNLLYPGESVEDTALVQFALPRGYVLVNMGWGVGPGGIEVAGSTGRLYMFYQKYGTGGWGVPDRIDVVNDLGQTSQPIDDRPHTRQIADSFMLLWRDFLDAVQNKRPPIAPATAGLRALEATLAAYQSAKEGRVVALPLERESRLYNEGVAALG